MMNTEEFKCVFCKESFGDKETLQEHFRKHGDKNFHLRKGRSQDEPALPEKPASNKDQVEMVECDVCPDVFTSISKAITHKHKVHPDHDAKYFCPWCGKLFTMKHLYNKHIRSTHPNNEKIDDKSFRCDNCNVDFNLPAAMSYHNKFFHRIFEMPTIGNSKKLKMFNQEVVPIYYCPFCGEEYDNKINLHKHMTDDHSDENQHPDDVLRCPVCEAVFHHLDAYEIHLTYHSVDDMYSERSAIMDEITDFSLETVPPIEEKVESLEPQSEGGAMGIEQLFELTMDDVKHKKKKHKKHKKSKKSAITLDQFLNMNTDVFGEGLDFQGVEEVASQSIAKRLKKPMKKPAQTILPPNIEKLKRQGIVIKKKPGAIAVKPVLVNPTRIDKTAIPVIQTKPNALEPNDVLSKLINQNNSQIKIVKKSSLEIKSAKEDTVKEEMQHAVTVDDKVSVENVAEPNETNTMSISNDNDDITNNIKTDDFEANKDAYPNNTTRRSPILEKSPKCLVDNDDEESNHSQSILKANETDDDQTDAETNDVEKLAALRINSNIVIKSNQQTVSEVNKNKEVPSHEADENISNHDDTDIEDTEQGINGETNKNDSLNALKHLSHLIVKPCNQENKSTSKQDNHMMDKKVEQTDVSKIAHLIRNNPSNITNTPKNTNSTQFNTLLKIKTAESKESKFESEDESYENDNGTTEPAPSEKLASILNSPHLNVQTIKKSHKLVPQKESPVESLPKNEKSSTDLLKHLKNVTAKPVNVNKTVNLPISSPKLSPKLISTIKKEPATPPVKHSKVIQEDIEIFNIDDSDSDEAITNTVQINKTENKEIPAQNKSADVLKNINKNITIKSLNNHNAPNKANDQLQMKEFYSDDGGSEDESHGRPLPHNSRNPKFSSPQIDQKKSALNNVLKNLGRNITVKTGNSSPGHFSMSDHKSQDSNFAQEDDSVDSETDSLSGRVKITEMKDASDEESHKELTDTDDQVHDNVKVQYPNDSNSDNEERNDGEFDENFSDEDIETHLPTNTVKNYPISKPLESFKNVCKDLVIKPSGQTNRTPQLPSDEIPPFAKSLSNRISLKNMKQADNCNKQVKANTGHPMNKSAMSQKMASSSNQSNTVNKEVKTVKTFQTQTQTQTVIQEITTTVTKTIKTVNQSMKQEIRNAGQSSSMPHKIQQLNANNRNLQGIKVRHTAPMAAAGPRVRNPGMRPARPVLAAPIRPSNQLVPIRPRLNVPRLTNSRMPIVRPSTSGQLRPQIGAPVKLAPGIVNSKRPNTEAPGHFSCFKKTKESLFPEADFSATKHEGESSVQFSSTTQMSKSNFASTTKTVKGNSVVTATQMKSEMSASSQQLGKLRNLSGLSVVKTSQANESHVEERSEISAAKQNTLDAIQKLQSQGLLVKKPRLVSAESEHSNPGSDDMEHFSDDEFGT